MRSLNSTHKTLAGFGEFIGSGWFTYTSTYKHVINLIFIVKNFLA